MMNQADSSFFSGSLLGTGFVSFLHLVFQGWLIAVPPCLSYIVMARYLDAPGKQYIWSLASLVSANLEWVLWSTIQAKDVP